MRRLLPILLTLLASAQAQQTRRVPQDLPSIQAAIDASASGDTVLVSPGTYTEHLTIDSKVIHLVSVDDASDTFLDGNRSAPILTITNVHSLDTSVDGFTLQHGLRPGGLSGGGILLINSGATLSNLTFNDIAGDNVFVSNGSVNLSDSLLTTAQATFGGFCANFAAINISGGSDVFDASGNVVPSTVAGNLILGDATPCSGIGISLNTFSPVPPSLILDNSVSDSLIGLAVTSASGFLVEQNLIYDNLQGGIQTFEDGLPSTDPAKNLFVNNTVVNNLNQPSTANPPAEVVLTGSAARTAFINNIIVGTTPYPVFYCGILQPDDGSHTYNETPLILDHNDVYNTTQASTGLFAGDCTPGLPNPLSRFGNISADPQLTDSVDLHLTDSSPAVDAGTNSAPFLPEVDFDDNPRVVNDTNSTFSTVDLGAYETTGIPDSEPAAVTLSSTDYLTPPRTITLSALVSGPSATSPSGAVTFTRNGVDLATLPVDATGLATLQVPLASAGLFSFTSTFAPAPATPPLAPTVSPVLFVRVTPAPIATPTTLSLAATPSTLTTAQTTSLAIQLSASGGGVPPGTVSLSDNGIPFTTLTPNPLSGQATFLTSFPAGTHLLTASYPGTPQFNPSSASTTLTVTTLLPSTLTLAVSPASPAPGQAVTLTAHLGSLTTAGVPGPVPPGAVTLYDGSTLLTTLQPDPSGLVTYTLPATTAAGSHTLSLRYAGTTVYAPSSQTATVTLPATLATTLQLLPSPNPGTFDSPVTLSATLSATGSSSTSTGPPTGLVRFTDGTATLTTLPLVSGKASFSTSTLALGPHHLTAAYLPDPGFSPAQASTTETIQGIPTLLTTSSSSLPSLNQPLSTLVTVAPHDGLTHPIAPSGVVSLTEGSTVLASSPLSSASTTSGSTTLTNTFTTPGTHLVTFSFNDPTGDFLPSSTTVTVVINPGPTFAITLSALPAKPIFGQTVTLSANLTSSDPLPASATIAFNDGATLLGAVSLPSGSASAATVTLTTPSLTVGTHALSASLRGGNASLLSTSNTLALTVAGLPSTLALAASPSPTALATAPLTLSASLTSALPSGHTPTGSVTFLDGADVLGTSPISPGGHAALTTTTLPAGPHTLSATFSGDNLLAPATAATTETILPNPTTTTLTLSPTQTTAFQPLTLVAQVSSTTTSTALNTSVCTPTCAPVTITFLSGTSVLGVSPVDATGRATLTLAPHAGTLAVTAAFSGTPLFSLSTSGPTTATVLPAPTTLTLTGSPNPLYQNGSTTLTATLLVTAPAAIPLPAPITLTEGATTLASLATSPGTLAYTPSSTGTLTLTATFPGTPDLTPASATLTLSVLPSDLTLSVRDSALSLRTTHHTTTTLTLLASGTMSDTVDLACPDAPFLVTCTFSPATTSVSSDGSAPGAPSTAIALAIDTDFILDWAKLHTPSPSPQNHPPILSAAVATPLHPRTNSPQILPRSLLALTLPPSVLTLLLLPFLRKPQVNRRFRLHPSLPRLLSLTLLAASALTLTSCSSRQPGHTPPGSYTLTLTAHAHNHNLTRTTHLTLTITP